MIQTRVGYQKAMQEALNASIESLTQRTVIAFVSANHVDPDMGAEMFVLEPVSKQGSDTLPTKAKSDRAAHEQFDRDHAVPGHH